MVQENIELWRQGRSRNGTSHWQTIENSLYRQNTLGDDMFQEEDATLPQGVVRLRNKEEVKLVWQTRRTETTHSALTSRHRWDWTDYSQRVG